MTPKLQFGLIALVAAFAVTGCQSSAPVTSGVSGDSKSTSGDPGTKTAKETPPPAVPDDLKSDAYHYYGLASDKPMKIKLSGGIAGETTGTQIFHLKSMVNGKATYEIERTDGLGAQLGSETLSLEKDGVYTIKSSEVEGDIHNIELPAKLTPGATWKNSGSMKRSSGTGDQIEQNETFKVVGNENVTTEAGSQDALLITSEGTMKLSGKTFRMDARMWYVKDRGLVKSVFNMKNVKDPKAKPQVITIQETK